MTVELSLVLAPRSARYSRAAFQAHYEQVHAPLFYRFAAGPVGRYVRNHIVRAHGPDPQFDTLSEFGIDPARRAELTRLLRSPEAAALEADVHDFLAERGNSFAVTEHLVAGPPRGFEAGPVAKQALLLTGDPAAAPAYAARVAAHWGQAARRAVLTLWARDPAPPMDALVMVWPAGESALPEPPAPPPGLRIAHRLDVESHMTAWV